ncbi:stage V sporulation protein AD [Desmospora profundinema]|uniref:Stage V sporulation protein AD n=1 Tax=Desmospora profundinema TaxID=1571184 RepID=A0ABU1IMA8_9BACL|nr:stage V sporulation protein AD [Desmospora profundinema]MDR6225294.1 stage V sporulation protein AD [Desmospora profundinema]
MASKKVGQRTWSYSGLVRVLSGAAVAGPKESEGQLKEQFDQTYSDLYAGEDSWEKAERKMMEDAVSKAVEKAGLTMDQVDMFLAGDLLNQNISASFTARQNQLPLMGMFGACSASVLTLSTGAALVDAGFSDHIAVAVSSHNATAERQYRYPTEYGGQKPNTAQWTVTGSGAGVLGFGQEGPIVRYATMGKVVDMGVKNPFDMGSAMAPAAVETITVHFQDTGLTPDDYDWIITGDLASVGHPIAAELLAEKGWDLGGNRFKDCGLMIYHDDQQSFAGASGCASSALVLYGHILEEMNQGRLNRVMLVATGALMNPVSYQQGESIPCIAHAVTLESETEGGKTG